MPTSPTGVNHLGMTPVYSLKILQVWYSQKASVFTVKRLFIVSCRLSPTSNKMNKTQTLSARCFRSFIMLYSKWKDFMEKEENKFWDWAFSLLQWSFSHVLLYSLKVNLWNSFWCLSRNVQKNMLLVEVITFYLSKTSVYWAWTMWGWGWGRVWG